MDFIWWIGKIALWGLGIIVLLFILIGIGMNIVSAIRKSKVKKLMGFDKEKALEELIKCIYDENYVGRDGLIELAEKHNMPRAMVELSKYYSEKANSTIRTTENRAESVKWKKRAAEAGDIDSIMELYFEGLNLKPGTSDIVLSALSKVKPTNEKDEVQKAYMTGVTYYDAGDIAKAGSVQKEFFMI